MPAGRGPIEMPDGEPPGRGASSHRFPRPVPVVGDVTSAAERAGDPAGWRFEPAARRAVYDVIAGRRDVRRFRPDAVPADVLERVLTAGHQAPSVGHSQPWRFIVVGDPDVRQRAAVMADRQRLAQAETMESESGRHMLDLKVEGLREAPVGVVICCDRRVPAGGVLGRATFPDADLWSCACAIENMWLAARSEGLGMGWVTLFEPAELAGLLGMPGGVEPMGWLCLGWPDERPPAPGLERAGWSRRAPLSDVVMQDAWPSELPPPPPRSRLRAPTPDDVVHARDDADLLFTPPGSLGELDRVLDKVTALGYRLPETPGPVGTLVLAVGRHPVAALGVSAYPAAVSDDLLSAARAGTALGVVAARAADLDVEVVDAGTAHGNLRDSDALGIPEAAGLIDQGRALGARLARGGLVVLGEIGIGNTTPAAALAASLLGAPAADVVGRGAAADSTIVQTKTSIVQSALVRWERHADRDSPTRRLAVLGGAEFAVLAGTVLGATGAGAVVVLDGLATTVAACLAHREEPAVAEYLVAGQRSRERGHALLLRHLGLQPILDLRMFAGEGVGATLATQLLTTGLRMRRLAARTHDGQG